MNSPFANTFASLAAYIAALADNTGKQYFPFVDQDLGQFETPDNLGKYPVAWPAVLIDIDNMAFKSSGSNVQTGDGHIIFRLGFPPYSSGSSITPAPSQQKALYYYDLEYQLHIALQGWNPNANPAYTTPLTGITGSLSRVTAATERRDDLVRVRVLTYRISIQDYSTKTTQSFAPATPIITEQLINPGS